MATTLRNIADLRERVTVAEFERRLSRLSAKHQRMVRDAMGTPLDPSNIPKSLWDEIERQHKAALFILLFGAAIPTLHFALSRLGRTGQELEEPEEVRRALERITRRRADWVAESVTETTRDRFERRWQSTPEDLERILREAFGRERWNAIARNESTAGQSAGGAAVAEAARAEGIEATEIWYLGRCEHCDTCPMLHGTSRDFWGLWSSGPPLHPNCCCNLQVFFDDPDELRHRRLLVTRNPNFAIVNSRMQKFIRPANRRSLVTKDFAAESPLIDFFGFTKAKVQGSLFGDDESDCGANGPGGGGFQPGNTCGSKRNVVEVTAEDANEAKKQGVKRSKQNPTVYFEKPIVGPSGVKLHSYAWQYKYEEDVTDTGEEKIRKVSDWDAAENNEETGRDIVHHFSIENKDGTSRTVSLETALKAMGYVPSSSEAKSITSIASAVRSRALVQIELQEGNDLPEWKRDTLNRKIEAYTQKIEQLSKMATGSENTPAARRGLVRRAHQLVGALLDQKLYAVIEQPHIDKRDRMNTAYKTRRNLATAIGLAPDGGRHSKSILADAVPERRVYGVLAKPIAETTDKKITSWYLEKGDQVKAAISEAEAFLEQFHPEWTSIKNTPINLQNDRG